MDGLRSNNNSGLVLADAVLVLLWLELLGVMELLLLLLLLVAVAEALLTASGDACSISIMDVTLLLRFIRVVVVAWPVLVCCRHNKAIMVVAFRVLAVAEPVVRKEESPRSRLFVLPGWVLGSAPCETMMSVTSSVIAHDLKSKF